MKRTLLFLTMVFCTITMIFAQGNDRQGNGQGPRRFNGQPPNYSQGRNHVPRNVETASVSGNLTIARGMIAVNSSDVTYIARGLQRFVGFIDGLKEGAAVTLEGNVFPVPRNETVKFLQVQKMTLNGKDYDLARPQMSPRMSPQHQMPRQMSPKMPQQRNFRNERPHQMHQGRNRGR
ncbi:MAG: hypothetical protein LBQ69_05560 [Treponema sp.]|jgi:hypothetical protein|nr:hypothetical protein [Treponema sp.]